MTDKETAFAVRVMVAKGIPEPALEWRFHPVRRWRFDMAWPDKMVALEIEGGVWVKGRHTRGKGFLGDIEKYNTAVVLGWRVLRTTPEMLLKSATLDMLHHILNEEDGNSQEQ